MLAALLASTLIVQTPNELGSLIPKPAAMSLREGSFRLTELTRVEADRPLGQVSSKLIDDLSRVIGSRINRGIASSSTRTTVRLKLDSTQTNLGDEGYTLNITPNDITIVGKEPAGVFFGAQTLRQMLFGKSGRSVYLPALSITDSPRFKWRGMHLDVSRHFFTVKEIKKYIDYLAEFKFNVFHWHLIDDGGWRMESKKYPKLTEIGAWRTKREGEVWNYGNIEFPGKGSGKPLYGGFYTQDQIKEIVKYAGDRFITVVPEIELPGHCLPAMAAYPEVSCSIDKSPERPYRALAYCAGKERTFEFLQDILDETMALFPSKVIHIGGDEVDKFYWSRCPDCQKRKADEGLKDEHELQSYFVKRVEKYLNSKGRVLMGWDEILEGGLAPNAQVMSWRGVAGGIEAAKSGHDVVMSPTSHCYFDYGYEGTSTQHVYSYEPVPSELFGEEAERVLGAQANVWTEWMPDFSRVEYMIFPRMLAMAEVLWSPKAVRNWEDFSGRLDGYYPRLDELKVNVYAGLPAAAANLVIFKEKAEIKLTEPRIAGIELRYTTDGTEPTSRSRRYTGPIVVTEDTTVSAAYFRNGKMQETPVVVRAMKPVSLVGPTDALPGMKLRRFMPASGERFDKTPNFTKLTPAEESHVTTFDFTPYRDMPSFALQYKALIKIEQEGVYTFTTGSDDGSKLWIDGALVVNNDYAQGYTERSGKAYLLPGWYRLELGYFEQREARRLAAFVEGPGMGRTDLMKVAVVGG
ncbi:MAG: family 20 glycosylhydrolase [Fimbriimonadaceae bacterium]|nr:family 20 glycosylhydrolase [Fimbriimonadaceae bacterium]